MKYVGSKARISKSLLRQMYLHANNTDLYLEPFVGGCNIIDKVNGNRQGNDNNLYIIEMWKALQNGWIPPKFISKEEYINIRDFKQKYPAYLVGYVGINMSYSGKWFGGYAGKILVSTGKIRDYPLEAYNNVMKQIKKLVDVKFTCMNFSELEIPANTLVYCDPPYKNTLKYIDEFDTGTFWIWVREISKYSNVFVSEYEAPDDFECIWAQYVSSSLSANSVGGGSIISVERLFTLRR